MKNDYIKTIYSIFNPDFSDYDSFKQFVNTLESDYDTDIKDYFIIASLWIVDANSFIQTRQDLSKLFCYIAIETLANRLEYYKKKQGDYSDYVTYLNTINGINKTKSFQTFLEIYCTKTTFEQIIFEKEINNKKVKSTTSDISRYIYQKDRCEIVHQGLRRNFNKNLPLYDKFKDENGNECDICIKFTNSSFADWLFNATKESFRNFLLNPKQIITNQSS